MNIRVLLQKETCVDRLAPYSPYMRICRAQCDPWDHIDTMPTEAGYPKPVNGGRVGVDAATMYSSSSRA